MTFGSTNGFVWPALPVAHHELYLCTVAAIMGGNVCAGLEDNIYLCKGISPRSNAQMIQKIVRILERAAD